MQQLKHKINQEKNPAVQSTGKYNLLLLLASIARQFLLLTIPYMQNAK